MNHGCVTVDTSHDRLVRPQRAPGGEGGGRRLRGGGGAVT
jgi:hypothetical protein